MPKMANGRVHALANILQDTGKVDGLGAIDLVRAYTSTSHLIDYEDVILSTMVHELQRS